MPSTARKIKNLLHSKRTPSFIFSAYFNRKNRKAKEQLEHSLASGKSLLDVVTDAEREHWIPRIEDVIACPDNGAIPRVQDAGKIKDGFLTMHNGIKVDPLSYYHYPMLEMLRQNEGVHEPQEEKVFDQVLESLEKGKKRTMLELGSYWSFYSLWFKKIHPKADCFMVEPDRSNLNYGIMNFRMNGHSGNFMHHGISDVVNQEHNTITVDEICKRNNIEFLDILHSDIQGFELKMLHGAKRILSENRVGYAFISTHSDELHSDCRKVLEEEYGFHLVASASPSQSYSWDGILVMKAPGFEGVDQVGISQKSKG